VYAGGRRGLNVKEDSETPDKVKEIFFKTRRTFFIIQGRGTSRGAKLS
jgi:hypothetical protein